MQKRQLLKVMACGAAAALALPALAADWPRKPIRLIVPFPAGGASDTLARLVAGRMGSLAAVPVIVENKPGAGGNIGVDALAKAPADDHALVVVATATLAINPTLYKNMPFDAERDIVPVVMLSRVPNVLVVPVNSPATTLQDLIAMAKSKPGALSFGSAGAGNSGHLAAVMLEKSAQIDLNHVPYKGDAQALTDLIGNQTQLMFSVLNAVLPMIQAGKIRALALASSEPSTLLPTVPTFAELGVKGVDATAWFGLAMRTGTNPLVVQEVNSLVNQVLSQPEVRARLKAMGMETVGGTSQQFIAYAAAERIRWREIVRVSGASVD